MEVRALPGEIFFYCSFVSDLVLLVWSQSLEVEVKHTFVSVVWHFTSHFYFAQMKLFGKLCGGLTDLFFRGNQSGPIL